MEHRGEKWNAYCRELYRRNREKQGKTYTPRSGNPAPVEPVKDVVPKPNKLSQEVIDLLEKVLSEIERG